MKKILIKIWDFLFYKQTCWVYCSDCGNELIGSDSLVSDEGIGGDNVVKFKCSDCGAESEWNFDLAPVPVKLPLKFVSEV